MSRVFDQNIPATELLLKIILGREDIRVISVKGQYDVKNPYVDGRNLRLDILAEDARGTRYNIEVQRARKGASPRRARYHSSMIDSRILKKGEYFDKIKDSYVIFITQNDYYNEGKPVYHIERVVDETGQNFKDGSHIIYVNGRYQGENAIGKLMHDFRCKDSSKIYYPELAECVAYYKQNKKGREKMCSAVEKYARMRAKEAAEEAAKEARQKTSQKMAKKAKKRMEKMQMLNICNLMETMSLTVDQAMEALKIPEEQRNYLQEKMVMNS